MSTGAGAATGSGGVAGAGAHGVVDVTSEAQFKSLSSAAPGLVCVFFWEDFHEASRRGGQMDMVVTQLAKAHPDVSFLKVQAEAVPEVSDEFDIAAVPTFIFMSGGTFLGKQEGANAPMLAQNVEKFKTRSVAPTTTTEAKTDEATKSLGERLIKLINTSHVMLFMKGTPQEPRCKFSRRVVELLTAAQVKFSAFNILNDDAVRQGLKAYSSWPTYPQVYVAGRLIGGHDVIVSMAADDSTLPDLRSPMTGDSLNARLSGLVTSAPVMLFMKGNPQEPRCGFSRQAVALLRKHNIQFSSFDILEDNTVRQGLKKFSNWPTYPQLYVKGKLVGGLDIMKQLEEDAEDDFASELGISATEDLNAKLTRLINSDRVVLFMKGSPAEPRCGFSRQAVQLLNATGTAYGHFDILTDNDVRQGLKTFSNWPTYPQLYVDGKLIGGLDIMKELNDEEELVDLVAATAE